MTVPHFQDAENKRWIKQSALQNLPEEEKAMFEENLMCYIIGKRKRLVPIIIPKDCVKGLKLLTDPQTREAAGVLPTNVYVFASTGLSTEHVKGHHCLRQMVTAAHDATPLRKKHLLTATKQRHRLSTKYANLDLPEKEQELFFNHMGHSAEVNRNTYQHPLPILHMKNIGKTLKDFDQGEHQWITIIMMMIIFFFPLPCRVGCGFWISGFWRRGGRLISKSKPKLSVFSHGLILNVYWTCTDIFQFCPLWIVIHNQMKIPIQQPLFPHLKIQAQVDQFTLHFCMCLACLNIFQFCLL